MRSESTERTLTVQGVEIPKLGFGTWEITGPEASEAVRDALQLGYRHFDFELDDEQRGAIASLARGQRTADPSWAPVWD